VLSVADGEVLRLRFRIGAVYCGSGSDSGSSDDLHVDMMICAGPFLVVSVDAVPRNE